ncbi:MAG: sulfatase-like hydrolase/transferase [Clostridiaceae bacterium]|nr:sulfatase-like hydrolase/transferase [Clostridiaceae bacterium]
MKKPNVLLITTDQQRFDTIAALGNNEIYTPHLNWLVDEGIAFTRCYTDCPICMPARATIMTGKPAFKHGLVDNLNDVLPMKDNITFPSILTKNGYQTRAAGKLHFHPMRTYYGIEHAELPMDYFNEMRKQGKTSTRAHGIGENEMEPIINTIDEADTLTHWIVDRSINFIENRDPTRPFFLWTSFTKPHPPLDPNLSYWELYKDAPLSPPVIGDWSNNPDKLPQGFYEPTYRLNNINRMSEYQLLQIKRAYYACISQIDYNLGLLFARMRELDLLENTWIIFTSDHGEMLGDHRMGAKSVFLEGSAHIPLIIKPPSKFGESNSKYSGLTCDKISTLADIMPTILSICGIKLEEELYGVNLLDYIYNDNERVFYGNCANQYFAIIENGYKFLYSVHGGSELMFFLDNDPYEQHNMADKLEFADKKAHLKGLMIKEMEKNSPDMLEDGKPIVLPCISSSRDVPRFPGLNTTIFPRDSFH